jgi:Zn-dependent alcohol dehydrogenase
VLVEIKATGIRHPDEVTQSAADPGGSSRTFSAIRGVVVAKFSVGRTAQL